MVYCTLKSYLARLKAERKMGSGKRVPNLRELSDLTGMSYRAITNITNNVTIRMDYRTASKIIDVMRGFGHDMDISDLIAYKPMRAES